MTSKLKKILLLNPPGKKIYMRDYYCSKISKAAYYYHPIDLVILSGILSGDFDIHVLDCIAEKLDEKKAWLKISSIKPDFIIFLSGAVSMGSDFPFLEKVREDTGAFMIGIGDIFLDYGKDILKSTDFIDAALLDFTTNDILSFLKDKGSSYKNIIYKDGGEIMERQELHGYGPFSIPRPRHELFKNDRYVFPFAKHRRFATVLTDFGCPFACSYCPVNRFGYKVRDVSSIIDELTFLNSIGVFEVVFKDQSFAAIPQRALTLCEEIVKSGIRMDWTCFSRADLIEEKLLSLMKKAGCHTIILGIETVNTGLLSRYERDIDLKRIKNAVSLCKSKGVRTVGTFIIGLPGDTEKTIKKTILFSKQIGCDYASFNIFAPAHGTKMRHHLIEKGRLKDSLCFMDSGASYPLMNTDELIRSRIWALRNEAVASFYFRPSYIFKMISEFKNAGEISHVSREAWGILKSLCR